MRTFLIIAITILFVSLFQWFLPWYTLVIPAFIIGFFKPYKKTYQSFLIGFIAVFLLWGIMIFFINADNQSILANRLSLLFFKHQWVVLLIFVNAAIGGLVAGVAMVSGNYLRKAL
jgi:hypothetical protein